MPLADPPIDPPRFRWLRRGAIAAFAIAALLLVVRLIDGAIMDRKLAAWRDAIRAAGRPVEPADLDPPAMPEGSVNGVDILKAGQAVFDATVDSPRNSNEEFPVGVPWPASWRRLAETSERANAGALDAWDALVNATAWDAGVRFTSPTVAILLPHLNGMRAAANAIVDSAELHHVRGDDATAIRRLRATLRFGTLARDEPVLVSNLVGMGIDALALDATMKVVPALAVGDAPLAAPRAEVATLIAELLDDARINRSFARTFDAERVMADDTIRGVLGRAWLTRPILARAGLRRLVAADAVAAIVASSPDDARGVSRIEAIENPIQLDAIELWGNRTPEPPIRYSRLGYGYLGTTHRALTTHLRVLAERRTTATALAIRLYRLDHADTWPPSLDALVPAYLPGVPRDPFRPGEPIGYRTDRWPDGTPRPLLFVGAGDDQPPPDEPTFSWHQPTRAADRKLDHPRQFRDLTWPSRTESDAPSE